MQQVNIKTSCIVKCTLPSRRGEVSQKSKENLKLAHNSTKISAKTKRMYARRIETLTEIVRYGKTAFKSAINAYGVYISFVTLTLPSTQQEADKANKRNLLNNFLVQARQKWNIVNYIWKAEKQKNGNIHYHILFDKFVQKEEIRSTWESILETNQYQLKPIEGTEYKSFSTWVVAVTDEAAMKRYICKYFTKEEKYECARLEGRKMGCSDSVRNLEMYKTKDIKSAMLFVECLLGKNWIKEIKGEFFSAYLIDYQVFEGNKELSEKYITKSRINGKHKKFTMKSINTPKLINDFAPELYNEIVQHYYEQLEMCYA